MKVKVKTFRLPQTQNNIEVIEEEIEDAIKSKLNDGYTFDKMVGDAAIIILVFTKQI